MHDKLTRSDIAKLEKELEERKLVIRPQLIEAVKEARAQGDLSENFEYHAARREKGQNDSRIAYLEDMIATAIILDEEESDNDEVALNKSIEIYFPDDDETEVYKLVTTIRGNSVNGMISIDSPIGSAILGHKVGETVNVKISDSYTCPVVIKSVGPIEDDSQDAIKSF
ncbi:MAG: transcription elongation factor GreA [Lachnospiraceae bacterium]|nr:transcription elongation factor GreA [Lachnospiraceae bacterium]